MLKSCHSVVERAALRALMDLCARSVLTGTKAWSCFSSPKKLPKDLPTTVTFTSAEKDAFIAIKKRVVKQLLRRCDRKCSYCRRAVGRYGFGWHIEHFQPKSRFKESTFDLANLTIGCVDCNRWKAINIDRSDIKLTSIINPISSSFVYGKHLGYFHIATEDITIIKYIKKDKPGQCTYAELNFSEIERTTLLNSMSKELSEFTSELGELVSRLAATRQGEKLAELLQTLKSDIYDIESRTALA